MRMRHVYMIIGGLLVILLLLLSDPDSGLIRNLPFGSGVVSLLIVLFSSVLYVGFLHVSRKALIDYIDLEVYFKRALQTPEGAGQAIIGVGLIMISISLVILAATR
ncbi:MAG: hypothetical protein QXF12_06025 [Candidatus Aenigmatarchaeota archaeon]